jgi:hypothetical protein
VHAVARRAGDERRIVRAVATLARPELDPGHVVRRLATTAIAGLLGVARAELGIERVARVPVLVLRGRRIAADLSLSHHGRFVAFACAPPRECPR